MFVLKTTFAFTGMSQKEMADVFEDWNKGELDSFLIEITKDILRFDDTDGKIAVLQIFIFTLCSDERNFIFSGSPLLEKIRDSAGQKGTGKWTAIAALEYGTPVTLIGEAVFARCLSALKGIQYFSNSVQNYSINYLNMQIKYKIQTKE